MQEIKFMAWDKKQKRLFKVLKLELGANWIVTDQGDHNRLKEVGSDVELMRWTGLKDKSFDEVDIYEGYLFGESDGDGVEVFGEVYFDTDFAGFCVKYPNGGWTTLGEHLLEKQNHREVIGNIYSNPELLEATK